MILIDHNIPAQQVALLRQAHLRPQQIGRDIGRPEWQDYEEILRYLHRLKAPTFFTRDEDFFRRRLCHQNYCLVFVTGLEAAQVRNEEAVNRHLRSSCLAQSMLQRAPAIASTSEQFAFAKGAITFGQLCRAITREVFSFLLSVAQRLFAGGYSCEQVTEALMPV